MKKNIFYTFIFILMAFAGNAQSEMNSESSVKNAISFTAVPNPASDYVLISTNGIDNATIKIIDILGNSVYSENISTTKKIDVSDYKNGIYFISIESSDSKIVNRRLIVKH
jgi:hypothetical protein